MTGMGNLYNNVRATGLIAQSNHYCPVIMGDNIICWRLVVMDQVFVKCALVEQTTVIGPGVIGPFIVGPSVVGPGDQTGRPYIRVVDVY